MHAWVCVLGEGGIVAWVYATRHTSHATRHMSNPSPLSPRTRAADLWSRIIARYKIDRQHIAERVVLGWRQQAQEEEEKGEEEGEGEENIRDQIRTQMKVAKDLLYSQHQRFFKSLQVSVNTVCAA